MRFFIDTANIKEIEQAQDLGVLDGVTTNPTLIAKELKSASYDDFKKHIQKICSVVEGPVSAEVTGVAFDEIVSEGETLAKLHSNVVVKCPLTKDGIKAVKYFSDRDIQTNATLVFSPTQALLAAKAGATMVSPFIGRLDDISVSGLDIVKHICQIFRNYHIKTAILAASIRHPIHILEAARMGADIATIPFKVIDQLFAHPLTDIGLERFTEDSKSIKPS